MCTVPTHTVRAAGSDLGRSRWEQRFPPHVLRLAVRAVLCAVCLLVLAASPASAGLKRLVHYVGDWVDDTDIKIIKTNQRTATTFASYLLGVIDSDHRLRLMTVFTFRSRDATLLYPGDAGRPGMGPVQRGYRGSGPAHQFDLAEEEGIALTAFQNREKKLRVDTWNVGTNTTQIRRLDAWEGERIYRVSAVFLRTVNGHHRFVTAVADSQRNQRVDVWDVEPVTGRIHHRGHAVGGRVGELSLAPVDSSTPMMVATVATDANNDLWTRVWKIDRAGNVTMGAGTGGGLAHSVGASRVDGTRILASVREGRGRLKMIVFRVGNGGNSVDRLDRTHSTPAMIYEVAPCRLNGGVAITGVTDTNGEVTLHEWRVSDAGVSPSETNEESGRSDRIACAGDQHELVAAVRDADHKLRVILYTRD